MKSRLKVNWVDFPTGKAMLFSSIAFPGLIFLLARSFPLTISLAPVERNVLVILVIKMWDFNWGSYRKLFISALSPATLEEGASKVMNRVISFFAQKGFSDTQKLFTKHSTERSLVCKRKWSSTSEIPSKFFIFQLYLKSWFLFQWQSQIPVNNGLEIVLWKNGALIPT